MTTRYWLAALAVAAVVFIWGRPLIGGAQDARGDVEKRLAAMEMTQATILKELLELKAILQGRPIPMPSPGAGAQGAPPALTPPTGAPPQAPPINLDLTIAGSAVRGSASAKLTIVEFSDFECPFCARYVRDTYPQIERDYVDTGKVRYVFRHFPLERMHPKALKAAEAAECARTQNKFWELHTRLFQNQKALELPDLNSYAQAIGLNMGSFQQCLAGQMTAKVKADQADGMRAGITGTPVFFFGTVKRDDKLNVLRKLTGAQPYANFKTVIDSLLASASTM